MESSFQGESNGTIVITSILKFDNNRSFVLPAVELAKTHFSWISPSMMIVTSKISKSDNFNAVLSN